MVKNACENSEFAMTDEDRRRFAEEGYLIRKGAFRARECESMIEASESLVQYLMQVVITERVPVESVDCSTSDVLDTTLKWEREYPAAVSGIETFAHLSEPLRNWASDIRLTGPCREACGSTDVVLFCEKLNLKRARVGGPVGPHRDGPHWAPLAPHVARIVTAMLYLDDSTVKNGCLEVFPGSHRYNHSHIITHPCISGRASECEGRSDLLEGPAGTVIWFGSNLLHRSGANQSDKDRRALLFSYQPAGHAHQRLLLRDAKDRFRRNTEFLRAARARRVKA